MKTSSLVYSGEWIVHVRKDFVLAEGISPLAKLVYIAIKSFCGPDSKCFPSVKTLSVGLGIGHDTVNKKINELKKHGLISREQKKTPDGKFMQNVYTLHDSTGTEIPATAKKVTNWNPVKVEDEPKGITPQKKINVAAPKGRCSGSNDSRKDNAAYSKNLSRSGYVAHMAKLPKPPEKEFCDYIDKHAERFLIISQYPAALYKELSKQGWRVPDKDKILRPIHNWKAMLPALDLARQKFCIAKLNRSETPKGKPKKRDFREGQIAI